MFGNKWIETLVDGKDLLQKTSNSLRLERQIKYAPRSVGEFNIFPTTPPHQPHPVGALEWKGVKPSAVHRVNVSSCAGQASWLGNCHDTHEIVTLNENKFSKHLLSIQPAHPLSVVGSGVEYRHQHLPPICHPRPVSSTPRRVQPAVKSGGCESEDQRVKRVIILFLYFEFLVLFSSPSVTPLPNDI